MFAYCKCGYDSGDCHSIADLKDKVSSDGGQLEKRAISPGGKPVTVCPKCKKHDTLRVD